MDLDFENKVAIVTGGTGGLGRAVVLDLLASGAGGRALPIVSRMGSASATCERTWRQAGGRRGGLD